MSGKRKSRRRLDQPRGPQETGHSSRVSWLADKRPVLFFVVLLAGLMIVFNAFFYLYLSKADIFESYLDLNAEVSAAILRLLGDDAKASGTAIDGPDFSMTILTGCDAIQASAFFIFIVLASPVPVRLPARLPCLVIGTLVLLIMNLVRIVSLYYVGVFYPKVFDVMHVDVWQPVFIFLPLGLWFVWLRRVRPSPTTNSDVAD